VRIAAGGGWLACTLAGAVAGCRSGGGSTSTTPSALASATAAQPTASAPSAIASDAPRELPVAPLSFHVVAKSSSQLSLDVLDDAALVYVDPARDALLLSQHRIQLLPGLFSGVTVPDGWSFGPVDGRWPDLALLTVAKRGYLGAATGTTLLRKSGARWLPMPGELAHGELVDVAGSNLLVRTAEGARFFDPAGHAQKLAVQSSVDGEPFHVTGASKDAKGRIFVSGFIHAPSKETGLRLSAGGSVDGGVAIVQRWEPGATAPIVDRMPDPNAARVDVLDGAGVYSSGDVTFALFGKSHALGKFQGGSWSIEKLPIDARCSGVRDFSLAKDGVVFFGTTGGLSQPSVFLRRSVDGRYERLTLPPGLDVSGLYAEGAAALWVASEGALYFTEPLGVVTFP